MEEEDYIKATNRVKVSIAVGLLRDVLAGDKYGITEFELSEITIRLGVAEERLFSSYEIKHK